MKKLIFTFALLFSTVLAFAFPPRQQQQLAQASTDNVKMYRQAGTSTEEIRSLKSTDELVVIRKHNANWTIVTVDGDVGYVLTSELMPKKENRNIAMAKANRR